MEKAYRGMGMEGPIARWYDRTTRKEHAGIPVRGAAIR